MTKSKSLDEKKFLFVIYVLVSVYMFLFLITFFNQTRRVTDENIFTDNGKRNGEVIIVNITKEGASDRAGLKVNDVIIKINGKNFRDMFQADSLLRSSSPGSAMIYTIKRDNETLDVTVIAALQKYQIFHIIQFINFLLLIILGLYVAYKKSDDVRVRKLSMVLLIHGYFFSSILLFNSINNIVSTTISYISMIIGFMFVVETLLMLPREINATKVVQSLVKINRIVSIFTAIILLIFVPVRTYLPELNLIGTTLFFILNFAIVTFIIFIILLLIINTKKANRKDQIAFIMPYFFYMFSFFAISFNHPVVFILGNITLTIPVILFYKNIFTRRYFDMIIYIRRNIQFHLSQALMYVFAFVIFYETMVILSRIELGDFAMRLNFSSFEIAHKDIIGFSDRPLFILLGIFSFSVLIFFIYQIQKYLKHKYFRSRIDYRKAFNEVTTSIASVVKLNDLYHKITWDLFNALQLKGIALLVNENKVLSAVSMLGFEPLFQMELDNLRLSSRSIESISKDDFKATHILENNNLTEIQLLIPFYLNNQLIGLFLIGEKKSEQVFENSDVEFIESVGKQLAIAFENKRLTERDIENERVQRDLKIARDIQLNLLPQRNPHFEGFDIFGFYRAAQDVGGDYYDFLIDTQNKKFTIVLGDVSGKGISASLYMSRFQGVMRSLYYSGYQEVDKLLKKTNELISSDLSKKTFLTTVCLQFYSGQKRMVYTRAGHLPILKYTKKLNSLSYLTGKGIALGLSKVDTFNLILTKQEDQFEPGDIYVIYSDGVTEAMNKLSIEFDFIGLEKVIQNNHHLSAEKLAETLNNEISYFTQSEIAHDDITFVIIKGLL